MEFQELIRSRYSCRAFSNKKIEKELIEQIIEAGRLAPTAVNTQPFKIFWLDSEEAKEAIRKASSCTFGADTFLLIGSRKEDGWERSFDGRNFADVDAAIVATHMLLAIEDLGLSTTWVGYLDTPMLHAQYPQLRGYELLALFPIGYAAEGAAPAPRHFERKTQEQLVEVL